VRVRKLAWALGAEVTGVDTGSDLGQEVIDAIRAAWLQHLVLVFPRQDLTREIYGMTRAESAGLLEYLYRHAVAPEFTYRHCWRVGDLVMWDNRCTQHLAPRDYDHGEMRHMCRTTLLGPPQGRYLRAPEAA
jgi:alpha-ketoglutarate-dependent taurine dioxygenase